MSRHKIKFHFRGRFIRYWAGCARLTKIVGASLQIGNCKVAELVRMALAAKLRCLGWKGRGTSMEFLRGRPSLLKRRNKRHLVEGREGLLRHRGHLFCEGLKLLLTRTYLGRSSVSHRYPLSLSLRGSGAHTLLELFLAGLGIVP